VTDSKKLDRGALVVRNVGFNMMGQIWLAAVAIATTPYIVTNLGVDTYGLYVIVTVVMGYFSFLDLGLGAALIKYISEYHAVGDGAAVERVVRTGTALFLIAGLVGAGLIALLTSVLVDHVLNLGPAERDIAHAAFHLAALGFLVNMASQSFSAVPAALQRFDAVVLRTIGFGTATTIATVLVLALGYGLLTVLAATLVTTLLTAISFLSKARRLLPGVSFWPRISRPELRLLMGFGALRAVQRISTRVVFQLDRLVVGAFAPIAAVSYYAVPLSLSQRVTGLVSNVGTAVFPATSALSGIRDERRIEELYLRAMKLSALMAIPIALMMFVYAHQIMRHWLGPDFEANASDVLMILGAANLLFAATTVPAITLDAIGKIKVSTAFGLVAAGANLALVFTLVPAIGYEGAAWAVLGNAALMVPMLLYYVHARILRVSLGDLFLRSLARPLLAAAALVPLMIWARGYVTDFAMVAGLCIGTLVVYVTLTVVTRTYDERDRAVLRSLLRRSRPPGSAPEAQAPSSQASTTSPRLGPS
jgi:O-antigen/teichoic acid export membrane protein